ncbi:MAG: amino acid adenylation domain-containing protein [Bacteroidetes bacterium]|nr:MAG: amino acid adenylation domain-containing protein [Bacteroidota bacterium]
MHYLLHHSILIQAERQPDADAFRCGAQSITYGQLAQRMQQLACVLQEGGLQRGDRVGIFMSRRLETAIAIYGILAAGAIYVPINPSLPAAQVDFLLQDCGIRQLITHPSQQRKIEKIEARHANIVQFVGISLADSSRAALTWEEVAQYPARLPAWRVLEQDLAYILYTSGSTGKPKGVMHTHYSGLAYARLTAAVYALRPDDILGNYAPIFFDISTLGYFTAPLVGATTVLATDGHVMLPASLVQLIATERMTVWYSVPLALVQMLQSGVLETADWSALRWVLYGGEPFPIKHLRRLMQHLPHCRFSNVYGPTETNQCTYYHLPEPPPAEAAAIPIGQVWDNTEILIFNAEDQPVASGETGELLVRSATMMRGYWNNPARTDQSFYAHTYTDGITETYYRTGDLFSQDHEGLLWLQGRKDRQVKIRGFRLELDEVEAALLQYPQVAEAAAWVATKNDTEKDIYAAVRGVEEQDLVDIDCFLRTKLPAYAIPQKLHILPEFPRTPTGKIDRRALQQWHAQISA